MTFFVRHRFGGSDRDPPLETLGALLDELDEDPDDQEHTSVSVTHESDWAVAVYAGGLVTLENVEELGVPPRHMVVGDRERILGLLERLAEGRLEEVFAEQWRPGYGPDV